MNVQRLVFRRWALAVALLSMVVAHSRADAVTIDWVTVGNPGNVGQTQDYNMPTGMQTLTFGAVDYEYRIMKFEFTNSQYAAFLNAVDPEGMNPNSIGVEYGEGFAYSGITNTGTVNGSRYAVRPHMGNKPVLSVSWWDAARVANWLHNGAQTYGSTDSSASAPQNTGAYTTGTATSGATVAKNPGALFYVPNENEWYKAAYYNPTLNGGTGGYRLYGNGFDSPTPTPVSANSVGDGSAGGTGNSANFFSAAVWNGLNGNVTTVGTNGGASYYGAFDMSGNASELFSLTHAFDVNFGERDGNYGTVSPVEMLSSAMRFTPPSNSEGSGTGFRLAAVPEPSTYAMALAGLACGGYSMWRKRKRA